MNYSYLRSIAVPKEHGGWGFLAESALLGMLLAPGWMGVMLIFLWITLFLLNQPLRIFILDTFEKKISSRLPYARNLIAAYGVMVLFIFLIIFVSNRTLFWIPLAGTIVFSVFPFLLSLQKLEKELWPEVIGALALSFLLPCMLVADGWLLLSAFALWAALVVRIFTSVVYVRFRLRKSRMLECSGNQVLAVHIIGFLVIFSLVQCNILNYFSVLGFLILCLRAVYGVQFANCNVKPNVVGVQEVVLGIVYVICVFLSCATV